MNHGNLIEQNALLIKKNKVLYVVCAAQLSAVLLLGAGLLISIINTKVVVVPPSMDKSFFVTENRISSSGLEQYAKYFSHLYFDISPETIDKQYYYFVENVSPQYQVDVKKQLNERITKIKELKLTSRLEVKDIYTNENKQEANVRGKLYMYQSAMQISATEINFKLTFHNKLGKAMIASISEIDNE